MAHHMMKMYFHFGYEDQFLFEQLNIDSPFKLWAACGVLFVLTILFEAIKYVRCVRCGCEVTRSNCAATNGNGCSGDLQDNETNTVVGFVLMLSVMSFNLCIIFAIVVGTATGYFVFYRAYNEIEAIDSCH